MLSVRRDQLYEYLSHIVHFIFSVGIYLRIALWCLPYGVTLRTAVLFLSVDAKRPFRRLPFQSRPSKRTRTWSGVGRRSHRGKRKTVDRVKIHDRQTFVADVGLYLWDRHPTNVYQ